MRTEYVKVIYLPDDLAFISRYSVSRCIYILTLVSRSSLTDLQALSRDCTVTRDSLRSTTTVY